MTVNRRRRRRTCAIAVAALTLTAGLSTGCSPDDVDHSLDCVREHDAIADSLKAIHEAGSAAAGDPSRTGDALDTLEKNLDKIGRNSDDGAVGKAVKDLDRTVADYNRAVLVGEKPDPHAVDKAASALTDICAS